MTLETILCIETAKIDSLLGSKGFINCTKDTIDPTFIPENLWFVPRPTAENNEAFRQIIPYIIMVYQDTYLCYQRTEKAGEKRLQGFKSIGFGGHVGLADVILNGEIIAFGATLENTIVRELKEEINLPQVISRKFLGLIYDDINAVSRVHIGFVELWQLANNTVQTPDADIANLHFMTIPELLSSIDSFETWSQLCIQQL